MKTFKIVFLYSILIFFQCKLYFAAISSLGCLGMFLQWQKHIVVDHVEHLLDTAIKLTVDALLIFFSACIFLWINNV